MAHVNETRRYSDELEPWQLLHLIAGSSTGGHVTLHGARTTVVHLPKPFTLPCLCIIYPRMIYDIFADSSTPSSIALMLGRLHMSVDECIAAYVDFSKAASEPKVWKENAFMRPRFRTAPGEQVIQNIVRKERASNPRLDASMRDPDPPCKVLVTSIHLNPGLLLFWPANSRYNNEYRFVVTSQASTNSPVLLRSYDNPKFPSLTVDCKIWEAARAPRHVQPSSNILKLKLRAR